MALSKYAEQYVRRSLASGDSGMVSKAKRYLESQGLKAEDYGYVDPEAKARQAAARQKIADDKAALAEANRIAREEAEAAYLAQQEEDKGKREANAARQKNLDTVDIRDDIREDRGGVDIIDTDNMPGGQLTVLRETTARFENMLADLSKSFFERGVAQVEQQLLNGDAVINNPLKVGYLSQLGADVSGGKIPKFFTDIFGDSDSLSAFEVATKFGLSKEQFTSIPAQAQRITAETPAMRELFKDQDYKATPFELEDAVLNGKTAEEVAEYVDPRYVTEAEAIAAFEAENGYRPSAEEVQDRIGQAEYTDATDAAGQEAYVNRTANHEQAELEDLKYYVDARQITVDEVKDYAAQNGLTISDEEAEKLARQGSLEEIVNEEQKIFDNFDERFVTRAELEGIARAEGYDPASLTGEDYAEFSGETSQSDAVKAIDTRATTEEELIEVFEQRTGIALDPYNPEDREKLTDMLEAATAANGGVVPSDAEFKAWTKKNIEYDLGVQVGRLATGVRNAIFGTGPGGRPKTLQEILDELLGPPGTAGFGGKSPLVIKSTPGGAIGSTSTGVFGSPNVQVEIKFPVPLPVNGPPIIVPLYEEGVYVGPSSAGELLVGEDGVITQVKDNVTTTVGRISGQVVQVVGAAGEVVKAIPLGALDNPGWREGDPNPNDLVLDESGNPALIDENGGALDPETGGLPVYEAPDEEDPVVSRSPYEDGSANDAFRNSSWPEDDANLLLDTLEDTLDGLGLDIDEIETILNRVETDLQNVTTAEDLETFRTNLINELLDPDTGLPSMGIDEDELGDALDPITKSVDDLEGAINDVGRNVGLRAVEDDPSTPDVDESRPATGLYAEIDALVDQGMDRAEAVDKVLADLSEQVGINRTDILEQLGITEANLAEDIEAVAGDVEAVAGDLSDLAGIVNGYIAQGLSNDEALAQGISDLSDRLGVTETNLLASLGETEETILDAVEGVSAQIDTTNVNISNLNDLIVQYEKDGKTRDEALSLALSDLSTNLGITKEEILTSIGESEETVLGAIDASEENTTEYLDYISQVIGIPATDLTQEDIDTVVGLIGEDEAITEINNDNRLYDVNFDGIINDIDIGILQGYVDVGVEGVGEIPATGLYLDAANRDLELKGFLNDQEEVTRGLISSEADTTRGLMGAATFFNALMGAGDLSGTRVDVSTPDPARINYIYDFEDVFATPQQKSLFPSPYGKPQMAQQQQMAQRQSSTSGPLQIGGMAQGGKVDYDFTDEIMQIMRYGDS